MNEYPRTPAEFPTAIKNGTKYCFVEKEVWDLLPSEKKSNVNPVYFEDEPTKVFFTEILRNRTGGIEGDPVQNGAARW